MVRSFFLSLLLHLAVLVSLFLVLSHQSPAQPPEEQSLLVIRPLKVADPPKLPKMDPGEPLSEAPKSPPPEHREHPPSAAEKVALAPPAASEPPAKAPPPKSQAPSPQLLLPAPDYPTRPTHERSMDAEAQATASGSGPIRASGEDEGQDRPALPYYHPAVTLTGMSDRNDILVKFEIEADARFEVEILEGTGNIHHDARVLYVLNRWKWLPMRIKGENLASVEIVRLFRRDTPASEAGQ